MSWDQAQSLLGTSLLMLIPYTSLPAGNELVPKLTKNLASENAIGAIINQRHTYRHVSGLNVAHEIAI
jgi:hypothetical protein